MPDAYSGVEYSDEVLAHYGKKGMKWGVRREEILSGNGGKVSRGENAKLNRELRREHEVNQSKVAIAKATAKRDDVLIKSRFPGDPVPTVYTGQQFVNKLLASGGVLDVRSTALWAEKDKHGQFVYKDESYQKKDFRK